MAFAYITATCGIWINQKFIVLLPSLVSSRTLHSGHTSITSEFHFPIRPYPKFGVRHEQRIGYFFYSFPKVKVEETAKYTTHTKTINASGTHGKVQG